MIKKVSVIGLASILLLSFIDSATAADRYIAVAATGSVKVKPDSVRINATTWSTADSNKTALNQTSAASAELRTVLAANGIAKIYIKSTTISVFPEYNYTQDKGSVLAGYKASQSFEIIVRNASSAGKVVDSAIGQVGDRLNIDGVTPFIFDQTKATATARVDAVKRAKAKATSYAKLLGVALGKIVYLDEASGSTPSPIMTATAKSDAGTTVVDLGTQEVVVSITTKWAIN